MTAGDDGGDSEVFLREVSIAPIPSRSFEPTAPPSGERRRARGARAEPLPNPSRYCRSLGPRVWFAFGDDDPFASWNCLLGLHVAGSYFRFHSFCCIVFRSSSSVTFRYRWVVLRSA